MELKSNAPEDVVRIVEAIKVLEAATAADIVDAHIKDVDGVGTFIASAYGMNHPNEVPQHELTVDGHDFTVSAGFSASHGEELRGAVLEAIVDEPDDSDLDTDVIAAIQTAKEAVEEEGDYTNGNLHWEVLGSLPETARDAVDKYVDSQVWQEVWGEVRAELIEALESSIEDEIGNYDQELRALPASECDILLVLRENNLVWVQASDMEGVEKAVSELAGHPVTLSGNALRNEAQYDAYLVPVGIEFDAYDAALVKRWGCHDGRYSEDREVEAEAA